MVRSDRGFSLLELLIVVGIILIVATIAIPSLLNSRQTANEAAAASTLKLLNTAQVTYSSAAANMYGTISDLVTAGLADSSLLGTKAGYSYSVVLSGDRMDYTIYATAASNIMGRYDFYTTPGNVITYSTVTTRAPASLAGQTVR